MKFIWSLAALALPALADKPNVPLHSSSRWILDSSNQRVKLRCINWAGHMEMNVPEGLHKQSIEYLSSWIANAGFNCVRLTYSIDMALNPTMKVLDSFSNGATNAGVDTNGAMDLYHKAVEKNPFLDNATVIEVFDAVQSSLWDKGVMTVLDNHVSKASWCCNLDDGNGWWSDAAGYLAANSRYFDTAKWQDGLRAMAAWAKGKPGIVAMSLRNEMRAHITQIPSAGDEWRKHIPPAGKIVHDTNPDVLVIVGGLNGGTDLSTIRTHGMLDISAWPGKHVWETHTYSYTVTQPDFGSCSIRKVEYGGQFGFVLEQGNEKTGPLFVSEFGVGMQGGPHDGLNDKDDHYLSCLTEYLQSNDADWAHWALQGSYYVRDKVLDNEETWGALGYDWADWRNKGFKGRLGSMFDMTQKP